MNAITPAAAMNTDVTSAAYAAQQIADDLNAAYWSREHGEYLVRQAHQHLETLVAKMAALPFAPERSAPVDAREAFLAGARYISMLPGPNAVLPPGHAAKAAEDYARKAL